tara:strand:- start:670 stop:915 length:246 start_codon:yes stop_codon:yes gene_type:complete
MSRSMSTLAMKLYTYTDHDEIPPDLWDYMTSVADIENSLDEVPIKEINEFLNFVESEGEIGLPDEELLSVSPDPRQLDLFS